MKLLTISTFFFVLVTSALSAQNHQLVSPDGRLVVNIKIENGITYSVTKDGEVIIQPSSIGMKTNRFTEAVFDSNSRVSRTQNVQVLKPLWGTSSKMPNNYVQMIIRTSNNVSIEFRAYNEGMAWQFTSSIDEEIVVYDEQIALNLPEEVTVYFPQTKGFSTPFEPSYTPTKVCEIKPKTLGLTPVMFTTFSGKVVVISESNLHNYPGMFIEKSGTNTLKGVFPKYPKRESQQLPGRLRLVKWPQLSKLIVRSSEDYIAKSNGMRTYPWRVIMVANSDVEILSNTLVYQLADIPQMDYSWVKPGKVAWDWYHNWNLQGVGFKAGINTQTYKYMIDFASKNGIEYVNIDDGWSKLWDFNRVNSNLNLDEVLLYAKEKNVGIFLWAMWNTLDKDLLTNLDKFKNMGIAGLKVDFFDRCDQRMVDFINLLAEECARRNLMLNLHGMYKPTGIDRTFPNVVNIEGVLGLEYNKFSDRCTPNHNLTIPFVRNIVGPMDYTPGAMRYLSQNDFKKSWDNPHAMTTRAHQLAMYIVYHGGVQMLADSPTFYEQDETALNFLSKVPVTWDSSIPLIGKIGEVVVIARRRGNTWYVGGMAGKEGQKISFNLDFLGDYEYQLTLITDGETAYDLVKQQIAVTKNNSFTYEIKSAGGFVMVIE